MDTSNFITFGEFYSEIRAHFSANIFDFEEFKRRSSGRKRTEFLLDNAIVQNSLKKLAERNVFQRDPPVPKDPVPVEVLFPARTKVDGFKGSEKYPQLSHKIVVQDSKKKGRHLVAKEKISPGELLIVERPYAITLRKHVFETHCSHCCRRFEKKFSCPNDCEIGYCSAECASRHYQLFHWAECGILNKLQDDDIGYVALMVYRTIVRAGLKTCLEVSEIPTSELENSVVYDSNDYRAAYLQVSHEEDRDAGYVFKIIVVGIYLAHFLRCVNFFGDKASQEPFFCKTNVTLVTIVTLLLRHVQSCSCNGYEISELIREQKSIKNCDLGGAVYPTVSLSNHSCVPNTMRHNDGAVVFLRAATTIPKGEEITDNYGHFFQIQPRDERRRDLKAQYFFSCECAACRQHWLLFKDLRAKKEEGSPLVCSGCKSPVLHPQKAKKCLKCKKELKLGKLARMMATLFEDARKVLDEVNLENVDKQLAYHLNLLVHMENNVQVPSAEFIVCQQVISQCCAVKGNFHQIT